MITGIDVSWFQGGGSNPLPPIDWKQVVNDMHDTDTPLVQFVYCRATYGAHLIDDTFGLNHDGAKTYELPVGAYHFYRYNDDADSQVNLFVEATEGREGNLIPMVDVEEGSFLGVPHLNEVTKHLSSVLQQIEHLFEVRPIIYTNHDTWDNYLNGTDAFNGHNLWIAQTISPLTADGLPLPGNWSKFLLWQNGTIEVDGIKIQVDYDILNPNASLKELQR